MQIEIVFRLHRRRYGYRRVCRDLAAGGVICAPVRVRRLMVSRALRALQPRRYAPTSDGRADRPSASRLNQAGPLVKARRPALDEESSETRVRDAALPPEEIQVPNRSVRLVAANSPEQRLTQLKPETWREPRE